MRSGKTWTLEDLDCLETNWGSTSVPYLAKQLDRTTYAVRLKAQKLGLGAFLESGEYVTVNQLFKAIGREGSVTYTLKHWREKGLKVVNKRVVNSRFRVVYLQDFWKWAKEYRMHIDFSKFKKYVLGSEPDWVEEQRKADIEFAKYKVTPWTPAEDQLLHSYLKMYRYTYRELSNMLRRTEGAIKRRVVDLSILERPLREPPHSVWADEQVNIVVNMYNKGYRSTVIKEYIEKSEQAINGKIERLIRDGTLQKRK